MVLRDAERRGTGRLMQWGAAAAVPLFVGALV
jgi:hypothetical protein